RSEDKSDDALVAAAEQLIAEGEPKASEAPAVAEAKESDDKPAVELKESEIPVVMGAKKAGDEKGSTIWRLVASIGILAVTAAAALYASKRWSRTKDKGGHK